MRAINLPKLQKAVGNLVLYLAKDLTSNKHLIRIGCCYLSSLKRQSQWRWGPRGKHHKTGIITALKETRVTAPQDNSEDVRCPGEEGVWPGAFAPEAGRRLRAQQCKPLLWEQNHALREIKFPFNRRIHFHWIKNYYDEGVSLVSFSMVKNLPAKARDVGSKVWSLVQEDPTRLGANRPTRHNYWACTQSPGAKAAQASCCSSWRGPPACPRACPETREPPQWAARAPQPERGPGSPGESASSRRDPARPKVKTHSFKKTIHKRNPKDDGGKHPGFRFSSSRKCWCLSWSVSNTLTTRRSGWRQRPSPKRALLFVVLCPGFRLQHHQSSCDQSPYTHTDTIRIALQTYVLTLLCVGLKVCGGQNELSKARPHG